MINGKDFDQPDYSLLFIASFADRATGDRHCRLMALVRTNFFVLRHISDCKRHGTCTNATVFEHNSEMYSNCKSFLNDTFNVYCETDLHALKFLLFYHVIEYLDLLGCLEVLSNSAYECCSTHIKRAYHSTVQMRTLDLEKRYQQ